MKLAIHGLVIGATLGAAAFALFLLAFALAGLPVRDAPELLRALQMAIGFGAGVGGWAGVLREMMLETDHAEPDDTDVSATT